ncbi:multidrug effflux MFS transporter [Marinobacterium sp. YM272]|uniref:multidrug effflux MFS transporter n=1 Tax=Marinobacterium sp. YM272 TaxID=3421654 RepID=UPI003D7FCFE8
MPDTSNSLTVPPNDSVTTANATTNANANANAQPDRNKAVSWHILGVLSALMGFASISTDFYLPAMPAMEDAFGAGHGSIEFTITSYLIGFCVGQLFWGPISDRYGRRLPIALGLGLFVIGASGCAMSDSIYEIIFWRVVQALGASAGVVLGRAMVRDLYEGPKAAQMMSTLLAVMTAAPLLGPIIGAQVAAMSSWRGIFWVLVAVAILTLAALTTIPETLPDSARRSESFGRTLQRYGQIVVQPPILAYLGLGSFFYAGMFAHVSGTPFAYIDYYGVPSEYYGLLFGAGIIGIMGSNLLNSRLVMKSSVDRLLGFGTLGAMISGLLVSLASLTDWGGLWGLAVPVFLFVSCTGFIVGNSIAGALADVPQEAGAVSALVGSLQYGGGIAGSALVGVFADGTPSAMGMIIALSGAGSLLCYSLLVSSGRRQAAREAC